MYCANCGVRLADTEERCPLCGTPAYHPSIRRDAAEPLYPADRYPDAARRGRRAAILMTVLFLLPIPTVLLCDLRFGNRELFWSGLVIGALAALYVMLVLPFWFRKPNPVIFVPCAFAAAGGYLWLIDFLLRGGWFWTLALPITVGAALIVTAVVTLTYYLKRGRLFIFGGAVIAFGGLLLLTEHLLTVTLTDYTFVGWSLYPLTSLVLIGGFLLFLGICRPARETMQRKFFI